MRGTSTDQRQPLTMTRLAEPEMDAASRLLEEKLIKDGRRIK